MFTKRNYVRVPRALRDPRLATGAFGTMYSSNESPSISGDSRLVLRMFAEGNCDRALSGRTVTTGGSGTTYGSNGSPSISGDSKFQPWLVVVGLAVIGSIALSVWMKKKFERRVRLRAETESEEEIDQTEPQLWDVYVGDVRGNPGGHLWSDMQPLSTSSIRCVKEQDSPSRAAERLSGITAVARAHATAKRTITWPRKASASSDEFLRVSVIVEMPAQPRRLHSSQNTTIGDSGVAEAYSINDDDAGRRERFDFAIGIAQVPYIRDSA